MRARLPLYSGVFFVMALSNAIVPGLGSFGDSTVTQGMIYSAYFLGAFLLVLPAGILSDRFGPVSLVRSGLLLTVLSGLLLWITSATLLIVLLRLIEGVGAGLFIPASLALLNARPDHQTSTGVFMSLLNVGLVAGLIGSGWLAGLTGTTSAGIPAFTLVGVLPVLSAVYMKPATPAGEGDEGAIRGTVRRLLRVGRDYLWLWIATVVIFGATGALTSLYPEYSDLPPGVLGLTIATMSISTAITVILAARARLPPVPAIRGASLAMAAVVPCVLLSPLFFVAVGALAGVVMVAELSFLAGSEVRQGMVMGLFTAASYAGMTFMPILAGFIAEVATFAIAFAAVSLLAVGVALTIGRCDCPIR